MNRVIVHKTLTQVLWLSEQKAEKRLFHLQPLLRASKPAPPTLWENFGKKPVNKDAKLPRGVLNFQMADGSSHAHHTDQKTPRKVAATNISQIVLQQASRWRCVHV